MPASPHIPTGRGTSSVVPLPSRCWVGGLWISTGLCVCFQANLITQGRAQNKAQGRKKPLNKAERRKKPLQQPAQSILASGAVATVVHMQFGLSGECSRNLYPWSLHTMCQSTTNFSAPMVCLLQLKAPVVNYGERPILTHINALSILGSPNRRTDTNSSHDDTTAPRRLGFQLLLLS